MENSDSRACAKPFGIAFGETDITFIYSFFCAISNFDQLVEKVRKIREPGHQFITGAEGIGDENTYIWRTNTHPERRGLTPSFDFVHRATGGSENGNCDEIYCAYYNHSRIAIANALSEDGFGDAPKPDDLRLEIDGFRVVARFGRNGMGTVSFTFNLSAAADDLKKQFPERWRERQKVLLDQVGALPFIFSILTLARAEHEVPGSNHAPQSKFRWAGGDSNPGEAARLLGLDEFRSLHQVFQNFYDNVLIGTFEKLLGPSESQKLESFDRLLLENAGSASREGPYWQSPYVVVATEVDPDCTYVAEAGEAAAQAWWYQDYKHDLFHREDVGADIYPNADKDTLGGTGEKVRVWQCYKEAVMLLLRLYQWRDILGVDEFLGRFDEGQSVADVEPHWRRVLVIPALLRKNDQGYLFKDVDLVWDTRFLMLYHERSTLVLNTPVKPKEPTVSQDNGNFRKLFSQSLMRTLEGIRGQLHASIVLSLNLDTIIEQVAAKPASTQDDGIVSDIQRARAAFAKVLRDPNDVATDAGALNIVRRRAHKDHEMEDRYRLLRAKFNALTQLFSGQSMISDISSVREFLASRKK